MDSALLDQTSEQFLGQWKRLVSTTNWDKGRIIYEWREALAEAGASSSEYSDEAWSRRITSVTPQHVGRLRRVFERFGEVRETYPGLYWSHFQAALDWDDAEMWLEGAMQSGWSISAMRRQRWEALGGPAELKPVEPEAAASEWDEDAESMAPGAQDVIQGSTEMVRAPRDTTEYASPLPPDRHDSYDGATAEEGSEYEADSEPADYSSYAEEPKPVRPFADLPSLPVDVTEAFEAYKLCILRHKLALWQEISCEDMLASLDALKELALAPAGAVA